ncbi:hypothetical protein CYLTODRAFT_457368 [Cylindrobasidium torrendii FP15055 ss-10]|uniref:Uncharacterized protein n=1 Tax=Cylindrobasidium torrendii FP15055 ss-10 TaxID=1314674 RepID=A0A0D7B1D5_9AGAR|nr:hypothetical protein CYLTODRAFT_457368 [Cylindrobasidium torrendii FP15055 ss-10]
MSSKFSVAAFLRFAFDKQEQYFAAARAKNETSAVRARLPKSFENGPAERIKVAPRVDPFFTKFRRSEGIHWSGIQVYCYGISLEVNCVSGEKKTLRLELQYWRIWMSDKSGSTDASNHELNLRYDGIEATAFTGIHGDCSSDVEIKMISESEKIQKILSTLMEDCGVEVEERPKKKCKVNAADVKAKRSYDGEEYHEDARHIELHPDVVDEQCMELLTAILGPSGKRVLRADGNERNMDWWTMMKVIQKGHRKDKSNGSITSFLRKTWMEREKGIVIPMRGEY